MKKPPLSLDALKSLSKKLADKTAGAHAPPVPLGAAAVDQALGGGLERAALHEIYARSHADLAAASGMAMCLLARAGEGRPVLVAEHELLGRERGTLTGSGLRALGIDPAPFILVRTRDVEGALRAGHDAARCSALGGVLVALWGQSRLVDLAASRRLSLAAAGSGVTLLLLRAAARPDPSAAATRWMVCAAPSRALCLDAPGEAAFETTLLRRRGGLAAARSWTLEWCHARQCFQERSPAAAALPRAVVSLSRDGPPAAGEVVPLRRAG